MPPPPGMPLTGDSAIRFPSLLNEAPRLYGSQVPD